MKLPSLWTIFKHECIYTFDVEHTNELNISLMAAKWFNLPGYLRSRHLFSLVIYVLNSSNRCFIVIALSEQPENIYFNFGSQCARVINVLLSSSCVFVCEISRCICVNEQRIKILLSLYLSPICRERVKHIRSQLARVIHPT